MAKKIFNDSWYSKVIVNHKLVGIKIKSGKSILKLVMKDEHPDEFNDYLEIIREEHAESERERYLRNAGKKQTFILDEKGEYSCRWPSYEKGVSFDHLDYESIEYADNNSPAYVINLQERQTRVDEFINILPKRQREIVEFRLNNPNIGVNEIARRLNITHQTVVEAIKSIQKKFSLFFN